MDRRGARRLAWFMSLALQLAQSHRRLEFHGGRRRLVRARLLALLLALAQLILEGAVDVGELGHHGAVVYTAVTVGHEGEALRLEVELDGLHEDADADGVGVRGELAELRQKLLLSVDLQSEAVGEVLIGGQFGLTGESLIGCGSSHGGSYGGGGGLKREEE
jgi:hypothetical protein